MTSSTFVEKESEGPLPGEVTFSCPFSFRAQWRRRVRCRLWVGAAGATERVIASALLAVVLLAMSAFFPTTLSVAWGAPTSSPMPPVGTSRTRLSEAGATLAQAERYLQAWDLPRTAATLQALSAVTADDPKTLTVQARLAFYRGTYNAAVGLFERAIAGGDRRPDVKGSKEFVRQTAEVTSPFSRYESEHFIVSLDEEQDGILIDYALDTLERAQAAIARLLGFTPKQKVRVEIFPDHQTFQAASSLSVRDIEVIGAIGICKFNKVMLLSPRALSRGFRWLDSLAHEYLHYVIVRLSMNQAPIWFHEGLAKYAEALWRLPATNYLSPINQSLLAQARAADRFIGFKRMEPSLVDLDTAQEAQLAYAESASAIAYILERYGNAGLRRILAAMSEQKEPGAANAIESALAVGFDQFQHDWKQYVAGLALHPVNGLELLTLKVKDRQDTDERIELAEIKSAVARNHLRLGDRLRSRQRERAALIEFRRALRKSPNSPPIIAKLGRALLRAGKNDEATKLLRRGVALYPDYGPLHVSLGHAYYQVQRYDEAAKHYREAVTINPYDPIIHRNLAVIARLQGRDDELKIEETVLRRLLSAPPAPSSAPHRN